MRLRLRQHRFAPIAARNRHDDHLIRRDLRRKNQAAVVAVHHDNGPDQTRRHAPRCAPDVLHRLVPALELDVVDLREILSQVVRRAGLQRTAVAHQRFNRIGPFGAGELLALGLLAVERRNSQLVLHEVLVDAEHPKRLFLRFLGRLVCGVPLLPEKFGRAQKQPGDFLPADDIGPLVDEDGQIAPRLHPLRVHRADDRLRRRTHDEPLFELFGAALCHPRHLRRKAFDMLGLAHQQALGNEQREVRVDVPRCLEAAVEPLLNQLPYRIAVRAESPCTP